MEKYIDHINNDQYQLLKKDPTTKIKAKTLEQLKNSKDNKIIDNKPVVPVRRIVLYGGSSLYNLNKYMANILKECKFQIRMPIILPRFPTSEMFPLKMMR